MKRKKYDPGKVKLSAEEHAIENALNVRSLKKPSSTRQAQIRAAAKETLKELKSARTNVRIRADDILALKAKAQERGLGYQTLISSILHMYISNELIELSEIKKMAKLGFLKVK